MTLLAKTVGNKKVLKKNTNHKIRKFPPVLFVGPHLLLFLIFVFLPMIYGLVISFTEWDLIGDPEWVGIENYREILFNKNSTFYAQFHNGLINTILFVVMNVPFSIILPLVLAVALNTKPIGQKIFQSIFYIPTLFSISAVAIIWSQLLNKRIGIPNLFGIETALLSNQPYAWMSIIIFSIWWGIGINMIIYQAAIAAVSKDLYESAEIDGAGSFRKFLSITLPSIKFPLLYTMVMTTIGSFNVYGQPLMLTNGGPNGSTTVLIMDIRQLAFGSGQAIAGIASAMAVILGLFILVVSAIQFIIMTKNK